MHFLLLSVFGFFLVCGLVFFLLLFWVVFVSCSFFKLEYLRFVFNLDMLTWSSIIYIKNTKRNTDFRLHGPESSTNIFLFTLPSMKYCCNNQNHNKTMIPFVQKSKAAGQTWSPSATEVSSLYEIFILCYEQSSSRLGLW